MQKSRLKAWFGKYTAACASLILCVVLFSHWILALPSVTLPVSSYEAIADAPMVILDAGHGGEDCGAVGVNGVFEKDINLSVCRFLASYLRAGGVYVVETRTDDKLLYDPDTTPHGHKKSTDLANRAAVTERYPNAVFISIHMNSFPVEKYNGLQVWYTNGNEESCSLARLIQETIGDGLQPDNHRKVKPSNGSMYLLDHVFCPSVLIECGFLTNRQECEKLSNETYQKELSFALFCVIMNYLNKEA